MIMTKTPNMGDIFADYLRQQKTGSVQNLSHICLAVV